MLLLFSRTAQVQLVKWAAAISITPGLQPLVCNQLLQLSGLQRARGSAWMVQSLANHIAVHSWSSAR